MGGFYSAAGRGSNRGRRVRCSGAVADEIESPLDDQALREVDRRRSDDPRRLGSSDVATAAAAVAERSARSGAPYGPWVRGSVGPCRNSVGTPRACARCRGPVSPPSTSAAPARSATSRGRSEASARTARAPARLFDGSGEPLLAGADRDQDAPAGRASDRRRDSPPPLGRIPLAAPGGARMDDDWPVSRARGRPRPRPGSSRRRNRGSGPIRSGPPPPRGRGRPRDRREPAPTATARARSTARGEARRKTDAPIARGDRGEDAGLVVAHQIEHDVGPPARRARRGSTASRAAWPGERRAAPTPQTHLEHVVEVGVVDQERGEHVLDHPAEVRLGKRRRSAAQRRQAVDDVAERAGADEEDAHRSRDRASRCGPGARAGAPGSWRSDPAWRGPWDRPPARSRRRSL